MKKFCKLKKILLIGAGVVVVGELICRLAKHCKKNGYVEGEDIYYDDEDDYEDEDYLDRYHVLPKREEMTEAEIEIIPDEKTEAVKTSVEKDSVCQKETEKEIEKEPETKTSEEAFCEVKEPEEKAEPKADAKADKTKEVKAEEKEETKEPETTEEKENGKDVDDEKPAPKKRTRRTKTEPKAE